MEKEGRGIEVQVYAKGKKEGGIKANFMVAISYGKGVVLYEHWQGPIMGDKFAAIVRCCFKKAFRISANPKAKCFFMDGCPRQNAIDRVDGKVFRIPAPSPDLNPIEIFLKCHYQIEQ